MRPISSTVHPMELAITTAFILRMLASDVLHLYVPMEKLVFKMETPNMQVVLRSVGTEYGVQFVTISSEMLMLQLLVKH